MTYCSYCGTELGTGGCPNWQCPSRGVTAASAKTFTPNPPAGTPNAVEEVRNIVANVRREVSDRMARENVVLQEAAYQRGRRDALREVRYILGAAPVLDYTPEGMAIHRDWVLAAIDQMEAK